MTTSHVLARRNWGSNFWSPLSARRGSRKAPRRDPQGTVKSPSHSQEPPKIGELIALADALRDGSLNPTQTEIVRALREGLGSLEDVKVQNMNVAEVFAN